ncbi:hypothetical protein [Chromobacterium phragmitis]|uniref:Uncharacterized protein n=1 Tax=Chromobacterium phragmitis TaxID=2202141 RepID=A0ABV0J100_9NEIS
MNKDPQKLNKAPALTDLPTLTVGGTPVPALAVSDQDKLAALEAVKGQGEQDSDLAVTVTPKLQTAIQEEKLPWVDANPRVIENFQLRIPEPLKKKLEWVANNTPKASQHSLALTALEKMLDRMIRKAGAKP